MSRWLLCLGIVSLTLGCSGGDDDKDDSDPTAGDDDDDTTAPGDDDDDDDDDDTTVAAVGDLSVEPGALDFPVGVDQLQLTLANTGSGMVVVDDVAISDDAFDLLGPTLPWQIPAGSELSVDVVFDAVEVEHAGNLVFISDQGTLTVPLTGAGLGPDLTLSPSVFDVTVPEGCSEALEVVLGNEGEGTLEVTGFTNSANLTVDDAPTVPFEVEPGGAVTLAFTFTADDSGIEQTGTLELTSNDPEAAVVTVNAEVDGLATFEETLTVGLPAVDVMLMIDQSCSMEADNIDDVNLAFPAFVDNLDATADWQLSLFNSVDGCLFGGVADTNTPYVRDILVSWAFPGIPIGSPTYSLTESLLQLASIGVDNDMPGSCNEGMLRPGAHLHVIVFSDEREQSGTPGVDWVTALEDHVSAPGELVVSGVVDVNRVCGDGSGADGYTQAINATGGLTFNICNPNWGTNFADAADLFPPTAVLTLDGAVEESSIVVTVDGVATTNVDFDAASGTLSVLDPVDVGAEVVVTYQAEASCE